MHRHPDEETLAAWFDGLLDPAEEVALQRELLECAHCTELLTTLGLVLRDEPADAWTRSPPPAAVTQRAMDLWPASEQHKPGPMHLAVRWLEGQLMPLVDALRPLQAQHTLRGAPALTDNLRYHISVGELPLEIALEIDGPEQFAMTIRPLSDPPAGALIRLSTEGEILAMSTLSEAGTTVPALPTGIYQLSIEHANTELGHLQIELN